MKIEQARHEAINPYQSPPETRPRLFVWRRLPYALGCAWRGYRDEMRRQGSKVIDHLLVWLGILILGMVVFGICMAIIFSFAQLWTS